MSKRSFHAGQWFLKETAVSQPHAMGRAPEESAETIVPENIKVALAPFVPKAEFETAHGLGRYFIPGWKGDSLTSKNVKKFNQLLNLFHQDAKASFLKSSCFNRKLKVAIFEEFIFYAEYKTCVCADLDDHTLFWSEIANPNSPYREILDEFVDIFCFRVAAIYVLKIRFICALLAEGAHFDPKKLLYPNSFLTTFFQKGGKTELKSKALEQNIYSWFRPGEANQAHLEDLKKVSSQLNVTEIIKNISLKSESLLKRATDYSHALSHKNFGLFLNSLLINFPLWLNTQSKRQTRLGGDHFQNMEVVSCKYGGDHLESLALSHWLAQEENKSEKWDQILCPDFKRNDFEAGQYWKIFNELQFLTFLAQIAAQKNQDPALFVSQVAGGHLRNRKNSANAQKSLLINDLSLNQSTYDRIVLNLTDYPKNNSQHFLISKIQEQIASLKDDGFLFVFSSKKLFVPSQKSKLESLLKELRVEGIFNLEEVKGKGEVGSSIYIFSKQRMAGPPDKKQTCFTFRLSAHLDTFQRYSQLTKLIQDFFLGNLGDAPPLYQKSFNQAKIEFFQDAIVNGRLIHSSSKDVSKITHPHFFNNLLASCSPLDFFFDIQSIDFNKRNSDEDPIFEYYNANLGNDAPYVVIVDQRRKEKARLEIILSTSLEVKSYEYGHSMCFYFGIYPKWPNLSIDAIRDFFNSPVGEQIIDLTFANGMKKVKANLAKVLLPKIFYQHRELPGHLEKAFAVLNKSSEDILETRPSQLQEEFSHVERMIGEAAKNHPCASLAKLSVFKRSLQKCLDMFGAGDKKMAMNFNNPILKTPLVLSKTYPIYPDNPDVYIEFNNENSLNLIHLPLEKTKRVVKENQGVETVCLELRAQGMAVLSIYSDEDMVAFLRFIFENLHGIPLSQLLQGVSAPRLEDLKSILSSFNSLKLLLEDIHRKIPSLYSSLINQTISRQ